MILTDKTPGAMSMRVITPEGRDITKMYRIKAFNTSTCEALCIAGILNIVYTDSGVKTYISPRKYFKYITFLGARVVGPETDCSFLFKPFAEWLTK